MKCPTCNEFLFVKDAKPRKGNIVVRKRQCKNGHVEWTQEVPVARHGIELERGKGSPLSRNEIATARKVQRNEREA